MALDLASVLFVSVAAADLASVLFVSVAAADENRMSLMAQNEAQQKLVAQAD